VGHETDFTITDYAADYRAATPTAAATLVYDRREAMETAAHCLHRLNRTLSEMVYNRQAHIQQLTKDIGLLIRSRLAHTKAALAEAAAKLERLSPCAVWRQGFALVRGEDGSPVATAAGLRKGDVLTLDWPDGTAITQIKGVTHHAG
jgi:exodeoxyribonuclease VII large subunit